MGKDVSESYAPVNGLCRGFDSYIGETVKNCSKLSNTVGMPDILT